MICHEIRPKWVNIEIMDPNQHGLAKLGNKFDIFDILCAVNRNKLLSKHSCCRWYETPRLMRRHLLEDPQPRVPNK